MKYSRKQSESEINKKISIDNYTEKQYKDYGWVAVNELLTGNELKRLYSRFDDAKNLKNKYQKTSDGEYMIIVGNDSNDSDHLVYIKGTTLHPVITKVVAVSSEVINYQNISKNALLRGIIENVNAKSSGFELVVSGISEEEIFIRYTNADFRTYREIRRAQRQNAGNSENGGRNKNGRRSTRENSKTAISENADISSTESTKNSLQELDEGVETRYVVSGERKIKTSLYNAMREEYEYAKRMVKERKSDIEKIAADVKSLSDTKFSVAKISEKINGIYSQLASGEVSFDEFYERCEAAADELLKNSTNWAEQPEEIKKISDEIRNTEISLTDEQKQAAAQASGGKYGDFYRSVFGQMKIRNDGIPLDSQWMEWSELYPGIFDREIAEPDMPIELKNIISVLSESYDNEWGENAACQFLREKCRPTRTRQRKDGS